MNKVKVVFAATFGDLERHINQHLYLIENGGNEIKQVQYVGLNQGVVSGMIWYEGKEKE